MLNLDQVEKELRALDRFDDMFLTEVEPTLEDMIGFVARDRRRHELLVMRRRQGTMRCRLYLRQAARRH